MLYLSLWNIHPYASKITKSLTFNGWLCSSYIYLVHEYKSTTVHFSPIHHFAPGLVLLTTSSPGHMTKYFYYQFITEITPIISSSLGIICSSFLNLSWLSHSLFIFSLLHFLSFKTLFFAVDGRIVITFAALQRKAFGVACWVPAREKGLKCNVHTRSYSLYTLRTPLFIVLLSIGLHQIHLTHCGHSLAVIPFTKIGDVISLLPAHMASGKSGVTLEIVHLIHHAWVAL